MLILSCLIPRNPPPAKGGFLVGLIQDLNLLFFSNINSKHIITSFICSKELLADIFTLKESVGIYYYTIRVFMSFCCKPLQIHIQKRETGKSLICSALFFYSLVSVSNPKWTSSNPTTIFGTRVKDFFDLIAKQTDQQPP